MKYIIKFKEQEQSLPLEAKNLTVEENILQIEHTDDSIEWIPLTNIDSIRIGTNQPWTKVKLKEQK